MFAAGQIVIGRGEMFLRRGENSIDPRYPADYCVFNGLVDGKAADLHHAQSSRSKVPFPRRAVVK